MAGLVRNFCVARGILGPDSGMYVYTVPAGMSFILKGVIGSSATANPAQYNVGLYDRTGGVGVNLVMQDLEAAGTLVLDTWHVLNDGDHVYMHIGPTQLYYWVSGALLPYSPGQIAPAAADAVMAAPQPIAAGPVVYLPAAA